jgi:hypothetical protein
MLVDLVRVAVQETVSASVAYAEWVALQVALGSV